ncbi:uncharacterized protein LOC127266733 [Andrographis paniculata]|uniref:uncharacterized protein LOC127266733 n=1 Tax=Andrographis paniculata TaxID=175694 RepID=UPI0021E822B4|nr:uncharacterized protein LOC127266733 [Andrographis paniculata]
MEGRPVSRVLIDGGAFANLMPFQTFRKLGKTKDDLIPTSVRATYFMGNSYKLAGIATVEVQEVEAENDPFATEVIAVDATFYYSKMIPLSEVIASIPNEGNYECVFSDNQLYYKFRAVQSWPFGKPWAARNRLCYATSRASQSKSRGRSKQLRGKSIGSSESSREIFDEVELPSPVHKTYPAFQAQDPLEDVDLSIDGVPRVTKVSALLTLEDRATLVILIKEYRDCFAWDYDGMPGLARELVEHRLPMKVGYKPHKQPPRMFNPDVYPKIKEEIQRLLGAGLIRTCRYPEWVSNVVPVLKKNGILWVCVDYRNLNLATPKDEYIMPIADMLVDGAAMNGSLSFMDWYSGYNEIFIADEDVAKTAFRCPEALGVYEWVVMLFGLKNAGATYQRAMNTIFHDLIGQSMEVYIDDIVVKSKSFLEHLVDLEQAFRRMRHYNLKMNPVTCAFGVASGNFLGFMVHNKGIEVDSNKRKAIINARLPENLKKVQGFLGQVNFLRRFFSNATGKLKAFSTLLKLRKTEEFVWKPPHQQAFEAIKEAMANPPVLMPLQAGKPLCLPALRGRQARWAVKPAVFDLWYVPIKAVKGQVIANILADHPSSVFNQSADRMEVVISPMPLILKFDGSSTQTSAGAGVFIESPWGKKWTVSRLLAPGFTNNQAEYKALLVGLRILHKNGAKAIRVQGDSQLILKQISSEFQCKDEKVRSLRMEVDTMLQNFDDAIVEFTPRAENGIANDLAEEASGYKSSAVGKFKSGAADGMLMKCVDTQEAMKVMGEVHEGICGAHRSELVMRWTIRQYGGRNASSGEAMAIPGMGDGYHWEDPSAILQTTLVHIVATDCFTKWIEAVPLANVTYQEVIKFIKEDIIHRYGILQTITADQSTIFTSDRAAAFAAQYRIALLHSSPHYAQANGLAEAANKVLIRVIKKAVEDNPRRWHEVLGEALWACRQY